MNEKTLQWAAKQLEQLRKPALAGRAFEEEKKYIEPRYRLDKDSTCYGCQHYKAVWELEYEPESDNVQFGGTCDCIEPCFAGSLNGYKGN